jgi:hypothetical protein
VSSRLIRFLYTPLTALLLLSCTSSKEIDTIEISPDLSESYLSWIKDTGVRRWNKDAVTVSISGSPQKTDLDGIKEALYEFSSIQNLPDLVQVKRDGDINVLFSPRNLWKDPKSSSSKDTSNPDGTEAGLTVSSWNKDGSLLSASVYIDTNLTPSQRRRTITHELLHALGAGHHRCQGALMFSGLDKNPDWRLPLFDKTLLELSYSKTIPSGASRDQVSRAIVITPGLACPSMSYESVLSEQGELWCANKPKVRDCQLASAVSPPGAGLTHAWIKNETLYSYNPEIYEAFETKDGRLLCFTQSTDNPWVQCELTKEAEITNPTLWSDGSKVSLTAPVEASGS